MPPLTIPAGLTLARIPRSRLKFERVEALFERLRKRKPYLDYDDWKLLQIVEFLKAKSEGKQVSWEMPVQSSDLFGNPRPYNIEGFLERHYYIGYGRLKLSLAVWGTQAQLHHLFGTMSKLAEHPFFESENEHFFRALQLFELTPGDDRYFFITLLVEE